MKNAYVLYVLVFSFTFLFFKKSSTAPMRFGGYYSFDSRCEPIAIVMCKGLGYNETYFPNLMKHDTQREASEEINQYRQLIMSNCSQDLRAFLCSLYAPVCTMLKEAIQPCRTLCKRARRGCIKLLKKFGYKWPEQLSCKKFPKPKKNVLCVDKNSGGKTSNGKKKRKGRRKRKKNKKRRKKGKTGGKRKKGGTRKTGGKRKKGNNKNKNKNKDKNKERKSKS